MPLKMNILHLIVVKLWVKEVFILKVLVKENFLIMIHRQKQISVSHLTCLRIYNHLLLVWKRKLQIALWVNRMSHALFYILPFYIMIFLSLMPAEEDQQKFLPSKLILKLVMGVYWITKTLEISIMASQLRRLINEKNSSTIFLY